MTGLVVKARGSEPYNAELDWSGIDPLVEHDDYLYDEETGTVQLLYRPTEGLRQLQVSYTHGYSATPAVLMGSDKLDHLARCGISTTLSPLSSLVRGMDHKASNDAAYIAATQPNLETVTLQPPAPIAAHRVRVHAPRDNPIVDDQQTITMVLRGDAVELDRMTLSSPVEAQTYTLSADPHTAYAQYHVDFIGTLDTTLRVSLIDYDFIDADLSHLKGSAPSDLSNACAMLAAHLYQEAQAQRTLTNDDDAQVINAGTIPQTVRMILRPYLRSRVTFV